MAAPDGAAVSLIRSLLSQFGDLNRTLLEVCLFGQRISRIENQFVD